jgi:hypothetical protein
MLYNARLVIATHSGPTALSFNFRRHTMWSTLHLGHNNGTGRVVGPSRHIMEDDPATLHLALTTLPMRLTEQRL